MKVEAVNWYDSSASNTLKIFGVWIVVSKLKTLTPNMGYGAQ